MSAGIGIIPLPTVPTVTLPATTLPPLPSPTLPPATVPAPPTATVPTPPANLVTGGTSPPPDPVAGSSAGSAGSPGTTSVPGPSSTTTTTTGTTTTTTPECPSPSTTTTTTQPSTTTTTTERADESSVPSSESSTTATQTEAPESPPAPSQQDVTATTDQCDPTGYGTGSDNRAGFPPSPLPEEIVNEEVAIIAVLASVEASTVALYTAAVDAAAAGTFGTVPPAVVQYLTTALQHHSGALTTWSDVLLSAGQPDVSAPPELADSFGQHLAAVTDVAGVVTVAVNVERVAAATYLEVVGQLQSRPAVFLAASILPVYQRFVSTLLFLLGQYSVPEAFTSVEAAYRPPSA